MEIHGWPARSLGAAHRRYPVPRRPLPLWGQSARAAGCVACGGPPVWVCPLVCPRGRRPGPGAGAQKEADPLQPLEKVYVPLRAPVPGRPWGGSGGSAWGALCRRRGPGLGAPAGAGASPRGAPGPRRGTWGQSRGRPSPSDRGQGWGAGLCSAMKGGGVGPGFGPSSRPTHPQTHLGDPTHSLPPPPSPPKGVGRTRIW